MSLAVTYSEITNEVAHFLGWNRTEANWTAAQNTDFSYILKRGLRQFYFPVIAEAGDPSIPPYEWSFLRKTGTLTCNTTTGYDIDAPSDFRGNLLDGSMRYAAGSGNRRLSKVDETELEAVRAMDNLTGKPEYFCVRPKAYDATAEQAWEFLVYPTPDAEYTLTYRYIFVPATLTSVNLYPVGGEQYGECLLASILAAAEYKMDDDVTGPMNQKFQMLLAQAVRTDNQLKNTGEGDGEK